MPLVMDPARGPAAEDKDYRPVEAQWLGGDIYRVVSVQPENECWEYPSGATVFAVILHASEAVLVIVAPCSESRPARAALSPQPGRSGPTGRKSQEPRHPRPRARFGSALPWGGVQTGRSAQIVIMMVILVATGLAWLKRYLDLPLHPADPIRASVVASCLILIGALLQVKDLPELRALRSSSVIVGTAFALSLLVGRCQT